VAEFLTSRRAWLAGFVSCALVSCLVTAVLAVRWADARRLAPILGRSTIVIPERDSLQESLSAADDEVVLALVSQPGSHHAPQVYRARHQPSGAPMWVAVLTFDVVCPVCQDVLAAAVFQEDLTIQRVVLLAPMESERETLDASGFVAQFAGLPAQAGLRIGKEIDALSGATSSSHGLVIALSDARQLLLQQDGHDE
jgi:hypothetical protein